MNPLNAESGAVFFTGGPGGLEVLSASDNGVEPIAILSHDGVEAESWEGYGCVNASRSHALAVFAPIRFANRPDDANTLGFAAVVDLKSREVRPIDVRVRVRYHTPGCGQEVTGVLSTARLDGGTDVFEVDLATGQVVGNRQLKRQIVGLVPLTGGTIAGTDGASLYVIDASDELKPIHTTGSPTQLTPRSDGGVDALVVESDRSVALVSMSPERSIRTVDAGQAGSVKLFSSAEGTVVYSTTSVDVSDSLVTAIVDEPPVATSSDGSVVVRNETLVSDDTRQVVVASGDQIETVDLEVADGGDQQVPERSEGLREPRRRQELPRSSSPTTSPCAIDRNDRGRQVYQPSTNQIVWAVDLAVTGDLMITRPSNWGGHGLPSYQPQALVPPVALRGGGTIPPQILLAVMAQESNMKHASWRVPRGMYGNPLIGDYYGSGGGTDIDYSDSDCGYGVGQITTGMRTGDTYFGSSDAQRAIAWDYTVNVAAAAKILAEKWNQLYDAGLTVQSGDASDPEAWYFALWAYNTGFYPQSLVVPSAPWGVGWTNNPGQPDYPPDREPYLEASYDDARRPSDWPYQERILGWASYGFYESGSLRYQPIGPLTPAPHDEMCDASNNCVPDVIHPVTGSTCTQADRTQCWWSQSATWTIHKCNLRDSCPATPVANYPSTAPEPDDATPPYQPACGHNFPGGTLIVDNVAQSKNRVGCPVLWNHGNFSFQFGDGTTDPDVANVDFHQIGAGFRGHVWFSSTKGPAEASEHITGTWKPPSWMSTGWKEVFVHVPPLGAESPQATYEVITSTGATPFTRVLNQRHNENAWVSLGTFNFGSGSSISLSNETFTDHSFDNVGRDVRIAWDAIAFVPSSQPTIRYVALGDSFQAGEGVEPYFRPADVGGQRGDGGFEDRFRNACHRSDQAYPALVANAAAADDFHFIACSGAITENIDLDPFNHDYAKWTEIPQVHQGYLDQNTTHVTIGIGGNDVRFADVLGACTLSTSNCNDPSFVMAGDTAPLVVEQDQVINQDLPILLDRVYAAIDQAAPNATVVVVGYPTLFDPPPISSQTCGGLNNLTSAEMQFMNTMAADLHNVVETAALNAGFTYYNPDGVYENHRICDGDSVSYMNQTVLYSSSGSSKWVSALQAYRDIPGSGSYHPRASGHAAIAPGVQTALGL